MQRIAVFCGSKTGADECYRQSAAELGGLLAMQETGLVYGGGSVGLMGVVADAVLEAGGEVIGVIPRSLATKELLHAGVPDMRVVESMHERKSLMTELADGFIALPGGYGTFEELFEVITLAQLGIHAKSIGLLNTSGYFDPLIRLIDHAIQERFIKVKHRGLFVAEERPDALLERLETHRPPDVRRWMRAEEG